ncbi:glycosyltransferase family 2 protein [Pedobacter frigiditerrae]|uniref:glycosyltransferase family 2 protein n=1 Tax=Pedobacter frigiditerrae TaxID=2530452 RepID=UPI00292FDFBF|nr:glycosyltransferase family 2 protein [Pedobacter frigiditerrae]
MDLSFIIVNYNTTALTIACIQSIYAHTKINSFEVILIDNASSTPSIHEVLLSYPKVILITNKTNVGFGRANNQGIEIAKGKYVFLLNSDTELTSDAAHTFFNYMEAFENKKVACCGAELVNKNGFKQVSYGNFPSLTEAIFMLGLHLVFKKIFEAHLNSGVIIHFEDIREVDFISGADLFIRKSILDDLGGFNPDFFLYFEEVELAKRITTAGYRSVIIPTVKIIHLESASFKQQQYNLSKIQYMAKSRRLYFIMTNQKFTAFGINKVYALQAMLFFCLRLKRNYLQSAYILLNN